MRGVVLGLLVLAACGGAARDAAEVTIANQGTPPPPPNAVAPAGPLDATLPAYAVAAIVLDTALVKRAAAGLFGNPADGDPSVEAAHDEGELEGVLDLPKGSLQPDRILDALGIDATRPIAAAMAPVDARERVGRLEVLAKKVGPTPGSAHVTFRELVAAFGTEPAFARIRVRVPVKDGAAAKRALRHFLAKAGLRESGAAPGVDLLMSARRATVAASTDGAWFVVDVYLRQGDGNAPGPDVVASIRKLRAEGERGVEAPPLGDDGARATLLPRALAEAAFVNGVEETIGELAKADADARDRIAATGLMEAHRTLELAGNERGDYFSQVRCALARWDGTPAPEWLRAVATFGAGFEATARVAARAPPDASLSFDRVHSFVGGAMATGLAFPMPGDTASGPADENAFARIARDAGWSGWVISAPLVPLYLSSIPVRPPPDAFSPKGAAFKLSRVAIVEPEAHRGEIFVGLLRAGTSATEAGCVLTGTVPCATHALRPDAGAVKMGSKFARVMKAGDRFVVIVGEEASRVDALKPRVVRAERLDLEAQLPRDAFRGAASAVLFGSRTAPTVTAKGSIDGERFSLVVTAR